MRRSRHFPRRLVPSRLWKSDEQLCGLLVPLAVLAVAIVLVLGLVNMLRGGNANTSQRLMRMRVLLQFMAIIIIMGVIWWRAV